jgi:uncharacterized protein (TIGR02284 family)
LRRRKNGAPDSFFGKLHATANYPAATSTKTSGKETREAITLIRFSNDPGRTKNMAHEQTLKILEELVETCRDGQNGYRDAADHVTDSNLRHFFNEQSLARAGFAGEIEQEIITLGKNDPNRSGSASAAIHRAWIDLKSALGGGDHAILKSVESGEDSAKSSYQKALQNPDLPKHLAALVRRQLASIDAAHDHVRSLRDARAA